MPTPRRLLAVAWSDKELYVKDPAWQLFVPQPIYDGINAGLAVLSLSDGTIITVRGSAAATYFAHFDPTAGTWSYKPRASAGVGYLCAGHVLDDEHVYIAGSGYIERYQVSTDTWVNMTPAGPLTGGAYHVFAAGADLLYACGGTANLWLLSAGVWTDIFAGLPDVGGFAMTSARDVWGSPAGNIYVLCYNNAWGRCYLCKRPAGGGAWAIVGGAEIGGATGDLDCVWCTDDSHIWVNGRQGGLIKLFFSAGGAWSTQFTGGATTGNIYVGRTIIGLDDSILASCVHLTAAADLYETVDGATWAAGALPGARIPLGLGVQEASGVVPPSPDPSNWSFEQEG